MCRDIRMLYPSIMAHMLNGGILFIAIAFVILYFPKLQALDAYRIIVLVLLFSIVVGIHGISHVLLEKEYQFIPGNLWTIPKRSMNCPCMKYMKS